MAAASGPGLALDPDLGPAGLTNLHLLRPRRRNPAD